MSLDMEERFREIAGIGERHPSFVLWAGSIEKANKWERLILHLAERASENAETGYDVYPLKEEPYLLCWHTFYVLMELGVTIPENFPAELNMDYDDDELELEAISNVQCSRVIYDIFKSLTDVYGFYAAYIDNIVNDEDREIFDTGFDVESCLLELAVCKIDVDLAFAPRFQEFKLKTLGNYNEWLTSIKDKAFRAGIPLKAELLAMVHEDHDTLGIDAEAENLGFNANRVHPDIYMNELLCGMRAIHQVLPVIMKKLGIDEREFRMDTSEFMLGGNFSVRQD
ncbi:XRE family transcriptional regulator [Rhodomicrobium udaipurense]|uniref:XRE family transcriptional regulator n=2 Tax=Rhodomicrobium udaipurense TaxID=1202716 RepID=A0A8I1GJV9_9HYPH|nr:XRE family transcriptional regulator [Rhodomicrobium udaipurense]